MCGIASRLRTQSAQTLLSFQNRNKTGEIVVEFTPNDFNCFEGSHPTSVFQYYVEKQSEEHSRNDYKKVVQLCLAYVGGYSSDFSFRRPGAMHRVRWMSKIIYCIKIVLLKSKVSQMKDLKFFSS